MPVITAYKDFIYTNVVVTERFDHVISQGG